MGIITMGVPTDLALLLKTHANIHNFIETGTYMGNTARWASQHFRQVITIENSESLWRDVVKTHGHVPNIQFLLGNSRSKLAEVAAQLKEPSMFWLDAHYSGGITYGIEDECPILEELEILIRSSWDHYILVDDARLFLAPPPKPHRAEMWPTFSDVLDILNTGQRYYVIVFQDIIIAVPNSAKAILAEFAQNAATQNVSSSPLSRIQKMRLRIKKILLR